MIEATSIAEVADPFSIITIIIIIIILIHTPKSQII